MVVQEHREEARGSVLEFALLTVSDSRNERTDKGGALLAALVAEAGHRLASRALVPDGVEAIRAAARAALELPTVDVLLVTGGTGLAPRDVTVEALAPMFEREIPGFGELFRMLSFAEIGAAAMLSRACAGLVSGRAIFLLPGSPAALELALSRLVLPEIAHLLSQARRPRNRA
ncbi:MAG: MogA/MoaB family molybdenum cofactor biosynthesis protein [Thermoanaerobaculia bacterium]